MRATRFVPSALLLILCCLSFTGARAADGHAPAQAASSPPPALTAATARADLPDDSTPRPFTHPPGPTAG